MKTITLLSVRSAAQAVARPALVGMLVLLLNGMPAVAAPPVSGLVPQDQFACGVNGHPLGGGGVYGEHTGVTLAQQMALLKDLGVRWYRCDVAARDPEPGVWPHCDELDSIVPAAEVATIQIYPTLHAPHELRPFETMPDRFSNEQIYQMCFEHARDAARKWRGRIKVWDLSNETDGWTIRGGDGDQREHYDPILIDAAAALLRGQADGIRAGDPGAKVALNVGGWLHTAFVDLMLEKGLQFDILDWHWYSEMGRIDRVEKRGDFNLLAQLLRYGKPLWLGEVNARPNMPPDQAHAWLIETLRTARAHRDRGVEALFVYELLDLPPAEGATPEQADGYSGYGLIEVEVLPQPDGTRRFELGRPKPLFGLLSAAFREPLSRSDHARDGHD